MAKITPRQYAQALYAALQESPDDADTVIKRFIESLVAHHQFRQARRIVEAYESVEREAEGVQELEVTSARPLTQIVKKEIEKAFGGKVTITEHIDPSLIGGVKIKTKDSVIDASIKQQLHRLHNTLIA